MKNPLTLIVLVISLCCFTSTSVFSQERLIEDTRIQLISADDSDYTSLTNELNYMQAYPPSSTCETGNVSNDNNDPWSEECYLNNSCNLQGNPCQANDVNLLGAYLADAIGNPIDICEFDEPTTVYLWGTFLNGTSSSRYAVRTRTEVWINGAFEVELNSCSFDFLAPGQSNQALIGEFTFTCGAAVEFRSTWVGWETSASQCSNPSGDNYKFRCGDYSPSKCSKDLTPIRLLSPNFTYTCAEFTETTTQVCFQDLTTGGEQPYSYYWEFGDGSTSTMENPCHTYQSVDGYFDVTLTVTDADGVMASAILPVDLANLFCPDPQLSISKSASTEQCAEEGDEVIYTITIENTGNQRISSIVVYDPMLNFTSETFILEVDGTKTFTESYYLTATDITTGTLSNTATVKGISPGTVEINVSATETIDIFSLPTATAKKTDVTCHGGDNGSITLTMTGGIAPFNYLWAHDNSLNSAELSNLEAGTYEVTITDANGCQANYTYSINEPASGVNIAITPTDETCDGADDGTVTIVLTGGTAPYNVTIRDSDNNIISMDSEKSLASPRALSRSLTIERRDIIALKSAENDAVTVTVSNLAPGNYTVTVTDDEDCEYSDGFDIEAGAEIIAQIDADGDLEFCDEGQVVLTASGGESFIWGTGATTASITVTETGTYTVTVTNDIGCKGVASVDVTVYENPSVSIVAENDGILNCIFETIDLTASSEHSGTFEWTGPNDFEFIGAVASVPTPGIYQVIFTDENGCIASDEITVEQDITEPIVEILGAETLTCAVQEITLTAVASDDVVSYLWSNSSTESFIVVTEPGDYSVTVTAANGCTDFYQVTIDQDVTKPTVEISGVQILTCALQEITLTADASDDVVSYLWSNGSTNSSIDVTEPGNFSVTVTAANGCTANDDVTIEQDITDPTVEITGVQTLTCAVDEITLTAVASDDVVSYLWSNGSTESFIDVTEPGDYSVTVTAANGCAASDEVTVEQDITDPILSLEVSGILTCDVHSVTLTANTDAVSITWYLNNSLVGNEFTINVSESGIYTAIVTGANGCTNSDEIVVEKDESVPSLTLNVDDILTCLVNEVSITATTDAEEIEWYFDNVVIGSEFSITVSQPGIYTALVTGENGCTFSETIEVIEDITVPLLTLEVDDILTCDVEEVTITATTEGNVVWFLNDLQVGTGLTLTVSEPGIYTAVSTAVNGCFTEKSIEVEQDIDVPALSLEVSGILTCDVTEVTLTAISDDEVEWFFNGQLAGSGLTLLVEVPGVYTAIATGENGCITEASKTVEQDIIPPVVSHDPIDPVCKDELPILLGTGLYSGDGVYEDNGEFFFFADGPGDFTIIYSEIGDNGCEGIAEVTITVLQAPCVEVSHTDVSCFGGNDGTITVDITCGDVVEICLTSDNKAVEDCNIHKMNGAVYTGLEAGTYYVVVTDTNGCVTVVEVTIGQPEELVVIAEGTDAICFGGTGSATVQVSGGTEPYEIDWNGYDPDALLAGEYTVTVTDANDCVTEATVIIGEANEMIVGVNTEPASCHDAADGIMDITINGNTDSYTLCVSDDNGMELCYDLEAINGMATWTSDAVFAAGFYTITVTDADGCELTVTAEVEAPAPLTATPVVEQPLCHEDLGSVTINISGGTEPYEINWNEIDPEYLEEGNYEVMISDANGCETMVSFTITAPGQLSITGVVTNLAEFGDGSGAIHTTVTGGTPPYTYEWSNGETTADIENLQVGTYSVIVTDANGCTATATFEVDHGSILVDLGVTIEVNIATPDPEEVDELIFALVVRNYNEEIDATGVVVENPMPASFPFIARLDDGTSGAYDPATGMWKIGTLPAGSYVILVYRTEMLLNEDNTSDVNTAQILPFDQVDPYLPNNYAEVVVTIGESTGGDDNGIESDGSMASQLALRNHRRLVESNHIPKARRKQLMDNFTHTDMLMGNLKTNKVDGFDVTGIGMLIPEAGPAETQAYISTPADLLGITNAKEIFAVDYLQQNNARRAAILAISTEPSRVYEHTKVICDRLVGAELRDIRMIEIAGKPFILSQLVHPNGYVDYAVSFIAQRKNNQFVIDNRWYNEEYQLYNSDDIFNFQVWSVTPQFTRELVEDILEMMEQAGGISFRNEDITPAIPQVYVHSGRYTQGGLLLNIVNKVGADKITIHGSKTIVENGPRKPMNLTVDIPTDEFIEIFVPTGFIFDAGFSVRNNKDNAPDVLYYADGAWMFDYDPGNAFVTSFETVAETAELNPRDYKVERDASFNGSVRTWASMFRTLSPRNAPVDLTGYDQVVFNASGTGRVEVMLAKAGVNSWAEQYRTTITLSQNTTEYVVKFNDLINREGRAGFTPEDVVSVIFNPLGNGNSASAFEVNISNLHFSNANFVVKPNAVFYPAYPNPFRNRTHMDLEVTYDNPVKVEVLNVFGQVVEVIMNEELSAGTYKISWEAGRHNPGVYMIRANVGADIYTTKVIHQR